MWLVPLVLACGVPDPDARGEDASSPPDSTADASSHRVPGDSAERDRPSELRTYRLLLVNRWPIGAVVHADAGAGRVLLDSVPRRDSIRVNVEVRAARLRLTAQDRFGERLGSSFLDLATDSLNRWEVPDPRSGSGADGAGGDRDADAEDEEA